VARCRTAQYYGGGAAADKFLLSFGARKIGQAYYAHASDFTREIVDGFADGFSEYIRTNRDKFSEGGLRVFDDPAYGKHITGEDVATHSSFVLQLFVSTSVIGRLLETIDEFGNYTDEQTARSAAVDPTWPFRKHLQTRDARGEFDHLKDEKTGEWLAPGTSPAMGKLGSNGMAVRFGPPALFISLSRPTDVSAVSLCAHAWLGFSVCSCVVLFI
jgi:hypothetical protein